jgi:proline racemase
VEAREDGLLEPGDALDEDLARHGHLDAELLTGGVDLGRFDRLAARLAHGGDLLQQDESGVGQLAEVGGGLLKARALCRNGKAERITITNVPSFADKLAAPLEVEGLGTLTVDTAYGGDSFVIVDARALGFEIVPDEASELVATGMKITAAANEQLGFQHPVHAEWKHISFCQFAGPLAEENGVLVGPNAVCVRPGKIDRSPTGTGCSARMAVLHAQGRMQVGGRYRARSIIGSEFECGIDSLTSLGKMDAILPTVSGRAWITGTHQLMLDPDDPWPEGYRIADTWPVI